MNARFSLFAASALIAFAMTGSAPAQQNAMTFFVTSSTPGKGADLGGLAGADAHCQSLAQAAGAGGKTWRAYLSAHATANSPVVNARDRIGAGPWQNAKGVVIAKSVDDLHSASANLTKQTLLTEKGDVVNGRGDTPNEHDVLTGSTAEGRAFAANLSLTCGNWTSSTFGSAEVGHSDRQGLTDTDIAKSWNSSHMSRSCSQPDLVATGGAGKFYCFAAN
jgi:hypothetical protein